MTVVYLTDRREPVTANLFIFLHRAAKDAPFATEKGTFKGLKRDKTATIAILQHLTHLPFR